MHRLLIVDDEPTLLQLLRRYLERLGYAVDTCETAEQAVAVFGADPSGYSMVITDLSLPGTNGADLIAQLRTKNPKIPALIASGYPYVPQLAGVGFLQKPFLPQMLADQIAHVLKR